MRVINRKTGERLASKAHWEAVRLFQKDGLSLISMVLPPGEAVNPHAVEDRLFLYVVRGVVEFMTGEESVILMPGDLAVDEPGVIHGMVNCGDEEAALFLMRQSLT